MASVKDIPFWATPTANPPMRLTIAIVITMVNLVGGFAVGVAQNGMSFTDAISTYSLLSVGDGLVSQIPALLLSVATGLVVTRSVSEGDMGSDIIHQLSRFKTPLRVAGGAAIGLCLLPGLPKLSFLIVGGALLLASTRVDEGGDAATADEPTEAVEQADTTEHMVADVQV